MTSLNWDPDFVKRFLSAPKESDNKYRRGVLGCITGSVNYPGAALLSVDAALATGVGMVRYLGPRKVKRLILLRSPQVVVTKGRVDAYVLGSGVSNNKIGLQNLWIKKALADRLPTVLDAGGLKFIKAAGELTVIIPHVGELIQVLKQNGIQVTVQEIEENPSYWAELTAKKFKLTVLLKGNKTWVANPDQVIQLPEAPPQLATAGSGDVLAGMLGGLLAINHKIINQENLIHVAALASYLHAQAAQSLVTESGGPILIDQLISEIPKVIGKFQK